MTPGLQGAREPVIQPRLFGVPYFAPKNTDLRWITKISDLETDRRSDMALVVEFKPLGQVCGVEMSGSARCCRWSAHGRRAS